MNASTRNRLVAALCAGATFSAASACSDGGGDGGGGGAAGEKADGAGVTPPLAGFLATDRSGELPDQLSDFELFDSPQPMVLPEMVWRYTPRYPLWTNGSEKDRLVSLPPGTKIDTSQEPWAFPVGTLFFKTFSYRSEDGDVVPKETRVIRLLGDGEVDYAAYRWDDRGREAERLEGRRVERVSVEVAGEEFEHEIPSILQCRTCHESSFDVILGFDRERLDFAPRKGDSTQLQRLFEEGWLTEEIESLPSGEAADETEESVLRYFEGNCVHCHNGGPAENAAFDLRRDVALENVLGVETTSELLHGIRVVPGDPEQSVLFQAVEADREDPDLKPMPPLGVQRPDEASIALLEEWILGLD